VHHLEAVEMAENSKADVLESILTNLRFMLLKSREAGLASLVYRLEVAEIEAEYQLTGVVPTLKSKREE
jgi:hypothetical protein